jgi:hypothetical protein
MDNSLGYIPKTRIAGSNDNSVFNFCGGHPNYFSKLTKHRDLNSSTSSPTLVMSVSFISATMVSVKWYPIVEALIHVYLMTDGVSTFSQAYWPFVHLLREHLFTSLPVV